MKMTRYLIASVCLISFLFTQCKDKEEEQKDDFKKEAILSNLADNYIVPSYDDLQTHLNSLSNSWNDFIATPSQTNLDIVRMEWKASNLSFHRIKTVEVGPAMTLGLNGALGTFPADTLQIETNVTAGTYNLASLDNIDAIGFESLDFLFFGTDCLNKLTNSANRKAYVTAVITKMQNEVNQVVAGWVSYRATFIAGTGTSSTSPFSLLVNAFCKDFELAKTAKIGIPIGTQSLGIQQPLYLEARRSGFGKELLIANMESIHRLFLGKSNSGANGSGFDDYLIALEKSDLSATIDNRFNTIETQPTTWSGTIENMMASSPTTLTDYYNYMQGTVVYMKTDMASAFGVLITYQDNDGD